MLNGTVKWFNESKGFGFIIEDEAREEYFVHYSQIQGNGFKTLQENAKVTFKVSEQDGKKQAIEVQAV